MRRSSRAPRVVDLAGLWTCLPPFAADEGGEAISCALNSYVRAEFDTPSPSSLTSRLRRRPQGFTIRWDIPLEAGLGGSAAQSVAYIALRRSLTDNSVEREEVGRASCQLERSLGTLEIPYEPHASALGTITHGSVGPGLEWGRFTLPRPICDALASRLVVAAGKSTGRRPAVQHLAASLARGDRRLVDALRAMKENARHMKDCLRTGDFDSVAKLIAEESALQRDVALEALSPAGIHLADLTLRAGALAARIAGISSTAIVALTAAGDRDHIADTIKNAGFTVLPRGIDQYGVLVGAPERVS